MPIALKPKHRVALLALVATLLSAPAWAGPMVYGPFFGTWRDKDGGLIAIPLDAGGEMRDLFGTDRESIYRCTCTADPADPSVATCTGDGYNHVEGFRFSYRNRLKMGKDETLTEDWEAWKEQSPKGSLKGQAVFRRTKRQDPTVTR